VVVGIVTAESLIDEGDQHMASRDKFGLLTGRLDPGGRAAPIEILSDVPPIMYPCTHCGGMRLHSIGEQPCGPGIGLQVPFMRRPLGAVYLSKGYHLICNGCVYGSCHLPKEAVAKLRERIIPNAICEVYRMTGLSPQPYMEGYAEGLLASVAGAAREQLDYFRTLLSVYRREDRAG
jgi:hypothetical protein